MPVKRMKNPNPQTPTSFKVLLAGLTFALVALFAALINILSLNQAPENEPLEELSRMTPASCGDKSGQELQSCCENDFIRRQLVRSQCEGSWKYVEGACSWSCSTE